MSSPKHIVVAVSGASGAIYAQQLLDILVKARQRVSLVMSAHAEAIWHDELGTPLEYDVRRYDIHDFHAPFASGSNACDACVIVPCSMGMLGRIAGGHAGDLIARTADVCFKERRQLIIVPRETPYTRIQLENMLRVHDAGATIMPASPSFYGKPQDLPAAIDTVVARIVDHLGVAYTPSTPRWGDE